MVLQYYKTMFPIFLFECCLFLWETCFFTKKQCRREMYRVLLELICNWYCADMLLLRNVQSILEIQSRKVLSRLEIQSRKFLQKSFNWKLRYNKLKKNTNVLPHRQIKYQNRRKKQNRYPNTNAWFSWLSTGTSIKSGWVLYN
jgi:hypothetical protein